MSEYRFHLQKYKYGSKISCPSCGKPRCFVKYVDAEGKIVFPDNVGKCDHENSCGYHYTPKEYFNDYPDGKSLQEGLRVSALSEKPQLCALYNLMDNQQGGTYRYKGEWGVLDQMVVNGALLQPDARTRTSKEKVSILRFPFLLEEDNVYGGDTPFRTYKGMRYHGGYSDHLPVLLELIVEE